MTTFRPQSLTLLPQPRLSLFPLNFLLQIPSKRSLQTSHILTVDL